MPRHRIAAARGQRSRGDARKAQRFQCLLAKLDECVKYFAERVQQHKLEEQSKRRHMLATADIEPLAEYREVSDCRVAVRKTSSVKTRGRKRTPGKQIDDEDTAHTVHETITEQPTILVNGKLKEYQLQGLEWLVSLYNKNLNGILADDMGLGKTIQTIALVTYLMEKKNFIGPFLVIVPMSTLSNWELEFRQWAPSVTVIASCGTPAERLDLLEGIENSGFNVLLTTFEYVVRDTELLAGISWQYMIIDESQCVKNHYCLLNTHFNAPHRLLLRDTPLQSKLPELWALLNFLLPSMFNLCSTFEQWFNEPFATTGEKVELDEDETILVVSRLHKVLRPLMLRRVKKEVESLLPDMVEHTIKCDMSGLQRVLYKNIESTGMLLPDCADSLLLLNPQAHLRKVCNHPFLFPEIAKKYEDQLVAQDSIAGPDLYRASGKFEMLDRILPKLKASGHRVLLFCQMTQCMTLLEQYLRGRGFPYLRLDGTSNPVDLQDKFNSENSEYFLFLLSTRAGCEGLNLQTADTVVIFDPDRNPHQDLKAQARAHRIGQRKVVLVLRLITLNSVEEDILAAARSELYADEMDFQAGMLDQNSTDSEQQQLSLRSNLHQTERIEEEENKVPDDEMELFKKMDAERRAQEVKPRLLDEVELSGWFSKADEQVDRREYAEDERKGRKRTHDREHDVADNGRAKKPKSKTDTPLKKRMKFVMVAVIKHKNANGRVLSRSFSDPPSQSMLPKYYEVIKNPIYIREIKRRIQEGEYVDFTDLENDFGLLCRNVHTYYGWSSQTYEDILELQSVFTKTIPEALRINFEEDD